MADSVTSVQIGTLLSTFVFGGAASFIAYQQWKTNALKVKIDTFDRRLVVYEAASALIWQLLHRGKIDPEVMQQFDRGVGTAEFLFYKEVTEYLAGLRNLAVEVAECEQEREKNPELFHQRRSQQSETYKNVEQEILHLRRVFSKHMNL